MPSSPHCELLLSQRPKLYWLTYNQNGLVWKDKFLISRLLAQWSYSHCPSKINSALPMSISLWEKIKNVISRIWALAPPVLLSKCKNAQHSLCEDQGCLFCQNLEKLPHPLLKSLKKLPPAGGEQIAAEYTPLHYCNSNPW